MITKEELDQVLHFVSKHWVDLSRKEDHEVFKNLPSNFWMNSVGGPAGKGRWVATLMYTDSEDEANMFKEVLMRWNSKGQEKSSSTDLIQIKK